MSTSEALEKLKDTSKFELLATSVLRKAEKDYRYILHSGLNAQGQPRKSPVDGFCKVPESDPPHVVLVEHTIKQRINQIQIPNTNQGLLFEFDNILLSKTGFTRKAGWCLALMVEKSGQDYVIAILGEPTPQSRADKARHLINNYVKIQEKDDINENRFYLFNF